ncbi:hypothetical protein FA13DRAFT_1776676 [Coprinellus micaceus]|uniref:Uncharacterized protein n=1 Tax=Coprinellus micaceus TaxID=71717 RepID=A0A4Y7SZ73_COPMI|nr:hypothetical protein FA13DRAFT_1776676 [Coprinellus micaceus]
MGDGTIRQHLTNPNDLQSELTIGIVHRKQVAVMKECRVGFVHAIMPRDLQASLVTVIISNYIPTTSGPTALFIPGHLNSNLQANFFPFVQGSSKVAEEGTERQDEGRAAMRLHGNGTIPFLHPCSKLKSPPTSCTSISGTPSKWACIGVTQRKASEKSLHGEKWTTTNLPNASHDVPINTFSHSTHWSEQAGTRACVLRPRSWIPAKLGPIHGE